MSHSTYSLVPVEYFCKCIARLPKPESIPGDIATIEPPDGQVDVLPNVTLQWESLRAKEYDIYFGEEGNLELKEKGYFDTSYNIEGLKPSTTYQWKIVCKECIR